MRISDWSPDVCSSDLLIENPGEGLHTLYVLPLKALAVDVRRNLLTPIEEMGLPIRVETRTGDTPSDLTARPRARPPQILLPPPTPLSMLLSFAATFLMFVGLNIAIYFEVHAFSQSETTQVGNIVD